MPDKNVADSLVRLPGATAGSAPAPMIAPPEIMAPASAPAATAPSPVDAAAEVPGPVRAGFVDDNADFGEFQRYLARNAQLQGYRYRDIAERYKVIVRDKHRHPVPNALVSATIGQDTVVWARTDQKGAVWFAPNAVFNPQMRDKDILLSAEVDGARGEVTLERGQKNAATIEMNVQPASAPRLDLVLLIDTTGSMGDEIGKLRRSLSTIVDRINHLPYRPDLCLGIVAYKDHEDDYVTKGLDLTSDVGRVQKELNSLSAGGGGDTPEALDEALELAVQDLKWRDGNTTRLIMLVTDAPPKMTYPAPYYDQIVTAALQKGIRIHSIGASGLDKEGELVLRQIAQYTGGKFVFLTYKNPSNPAEGSGDKTAHDVSNYSVDTLDDLIVRLIKEDLSNGIE